MQSVAMRIGGRDAGSADGRFYEKRNPFTGELVARVPDAGPLDAAAAVGAAAAAFREWSKTPPSKRRAILWKAADLLEGRAQEIAKIITAETGGTFGWGMFNTFFAASIMREAACSTTQITGEVIPSDIPGNIALAVRQPVGVVAAIAPWNAPMILGVRAVAMPLACGNTVVLKASEECPQTHRIIGEVLEAAGLPAGAINVLTTSREGAAATVDALISDTARQAHQLHGLHARRQDHRRKGGEVLEAGAAWSSAARRRSWCSTTPISTRRRRRRISGPSCTRVRSACRPSASWCRSRSRVSSSTN